MPGFTLFLGFLIDRMHHYLRKLINLRDSVGESKDEVENLRKEKKKFKEKEENAGEEKKQLREEMSCQRT